MSMLDEAMKLAGEGFLIFPLQANGKPHIKGWPEKATRDPDQIRQWWTKWSNANVGIHCAEQNGQPLLVVDLDVKGGKNGPQVWFDLGGSGVRTRAVETPSGGRHLYFYSPHHVKNSAGEIGEGIDIRSRGGYVVAPGSCKAGQGEYRIIDNSPIAQAPAWLVAKLQEARKVEPSPSREAPEGVDLDLALERAAERLKDRAPAIEGQGGDAWTFKTACVVRDCGVPQDHALEALEAWNERCEPPWAPEDLEKKIANAYAYAQDAPARDAVEVMFDDVSDEACAEASDAIEKAREESKAKPKLVRIRAADVLSPDEKKKWTRDYLVKGWIDAGADAQIFADYGEGKTFVALDLSVCLAGGESWFGQRTRQCGVLYLLWEGHSGILLRLAALRKKYEHLDWNNLPLDVIPMTRRLVDGSNRPQKDLPGRQILQEAIRQFKDDYGTLPGLLVADTFSRAIGGSASDEELAQQFGEMVGELRKTYGMATLRLHHPGHGVKNRGRGAYAIVAGIDTDIRLHDGVIESLKERDYPTTRLGYRLTPVQLGKDQDGEDVTSCIVEQTSLENAGDLDPTEQQTLGIIRSAAGSGSVAGRRDVLKGLREAGIVDPGGTGGTQARRLYGRLRDAGRISFDYSKITLLEQGAAVEFDSQLPSGEETVDVFS